MKKTDRMTNIIAFLLFAALAAYAVVYALHAMQGATVTAEAVAAEIELSGVANGIVVREETLLTSDEPFIDVTAREGMKLAAGSPIATAVADEDGMARARRVHELEREITRVSAALGEISSADDLTARESSLTSVSRSLAAAVARHDAAALDSAALNLEGLLLGRENETVSEANLAALKAELQSIQTSTAPGETVLTAETAGVFTSLVDGYEHLSADDLDRLTPSSLQKLIDSGEEPPENAFGKLVRDYRWYFAAVMSTVDAANLTPGRTATLNFGRWYSTDVTARVMSVGASENGSVVVIFRCDTALADTLGMRNVTANVVFGSYSGIRVPAQALHVDDKAETAYVWTVTAMQLERKDVEIVYAAGDYVIVSRGAEPGSLREGNTVVVSGVDLQEGKIIE